MPYGGKTSVLSFLILGQEEGERVALALNGGKGGPLPQAQNVQKLLGSQNCWGHPPDVPISCSRFGPDRDTADRAWLNICCWLCLLPSNTYAGLLHEVRTS